MLKQTAAFFALILVSPLLFCQGNVLEYASGISASELKDNLTILSSDALEGRYTGSRGQKMAAAYISNFFEEIGLEPPVNGTYYQTIPLFSMRQESVFLESGPNRFENFTDLFYTDEGGTGGIVKTELVFVGRGRDEDLAQVDCKGKAALVLFDNLTSSNVEDLEDKANNIRAKGAKYIFAVPGSAPGEFEQVAARARSRQVQGVISLSEPDKIGLNGIVYLKSSAVEKILNTSMDRIKSIGSTQPAKKPLKQIKSVNISFQVALNIVPIRSENVIGYLPGSDKKGEVVVITSHYDHLGKKNASETDIIYNGADDDGSGTVAMMQIAKAFAAAKKSGGQSRRSLLFIAFSGEEQGKLGSEFYVHHPVVPLANTVVNLNMDMLGRIDKAHEENKKYVYIIGADKLSTELNEINERMNRTYTQLNFDYTYNSEDHPTRYYYRSDHWNFARNNIPVIFYFNGSHKDYHKVTDEVGSIDFELLATRAQLVFYTAWEITNRVDRIKVDVK